MSLTSLWRHVTPPGPVCETLDYGIKADVVVIGAGFTGLSTAWHLRERGLDVVVLEGRDVGYGASGRNNGQVIPVMTRADPDMLVAKFGEVGERFVQLIGGSAGFLFDLVRKLELNCEAEQSGWIQPAHSPGRVRAISQNRFRQWQAHGAPVELLDRAEVSKRLGTDFFYGGFGNPTGGHINPLALVRELARVSVAAGVKIYENSPATVIARDGDNWWVTTAKGSVKAKAMVVATNTYTGELSPGLLPKLAKSVLPVASWQMSTAPLSEALRQSIVPGRQAVSDTHGDLHFFRYDARNRLITGGALALPFNKKPRIKAHIERRLTKIFPQFENPEIDFVWTGYVGMTRDFTPHFHKLGPNGWAWVGCNGRGVALSVALGKELARAVAQPNDKALPFPITEIKTLPLQPLLRRVSRPFTLSLYRWRDSREIG